MRQEPTGFETLWKLWLPYARKTDGRGKARPTYIKWLEAGADPQDMLDGAQWHLRSLSERDRPYINLLSVYLNSERWMDELVEPVVEGEAATEVQIRHDVLDRDFNRLTDRGEAL